MTKENFTSINVIVDESGSMGGLVKDTVGGFNKFLADQKDVPGDAVFTLCLFATKHNRPFDFVKLADVPDLTSRTYRPGGSTALLDAIGTTINHVGAKLSAMPEEERPSKVIFLIITDGEENASREFTKAQVASMISHQREVYSWEFVFMGANIDAIAEGSSLGIASHNAINYSASSAGTAKLYGDVSRSLRTYRSSKGPSKVDFFNQQPVDVDIINPVDQTVNKDSDKS